MPANLTTLPHFSVSCARSVPNAAAEPGSTVAPKAAKRRGGQREYEERAVFIGSISVWDTIGTLDARSIENRYAISVIAEPRYGTCTRLTPVIILNSSPA